MAAGTHRLDQLLSSLGYCTRSEARDWLSAGRVTVKGEETTDHGLKVRAEDLQHVRVDGEPLDHPEGILIAFNKPEGIVCSHDRREGETVYDYLPEQWLRRNPPVTTVGRLDKDTEGLVLITDQGVLAHQLASPKHKVPKLYRVTVDKDLTEGLVDVFARGTLMLEGEEDPCAPAELKIVGPREAELTLYEGRNRQVRRMFTSQGYLVTSLVREKFGPLSVEGIELGEWKELPVDYFDK